MSELFSYEEWAREFWKPRRKTRGDWSEYSKSDRLTTLLLRAHKAGRRERDLEILAIVDNGGRLTAHQLLGRIMTLVDTAKYLDPEPSGESCPVCGKPVTVMDSQLPDYRGRPVHKACGLGRYFAGEDPRSDPEPSEES